MPRPVPRHSSFLTDTEFCWLCMPACTSPRAEPNVLSAACNHLFLPLFLPHAHTPCTYKISFERLGPILKSIKAMRYTKDLWDHLRFSENSINVFTVVLVAGLLLYLNLLSPDLLHWSADFKPCYSRLCHSIKLSLIKTFTDDQNI